MALSVLMPLCIGGGQKMGLKSVNSNESSQEKGKLRNHSRDVQNDLPEGRISLPSLDRGEGDHRQQL